MNWKSDRMILDQIGRFRLTTDQLLPVADREHAVLSIERLLRQGCIRQWRHRSGLRYWTRPANRALSDESLVRNLGILMFVSQHKSRDTLTSQDIHDYFPTLHRHGLPRGHYVDRGESRPTLGIVRIDTGQSKVTRLKERTLRLIAGYRRSAAFRDLIDSDVLEITWVLPTDRKRNRLIEAITPLSKCGIRLRVEANRAMLNIIAPLAAR